MAERFREYVVGNIEDQIVSSTVERKFRVPGMTLKHIGVGSHSTSIFIFLWPNGGCWNTDSLGSGADLSECGEEFLTVMQFVCGL